MRWSDGQASARSLSGQDQFQSSIDQLRSVLHSRRNGVIFLDSIVRAKRKQFYIVRVDQSIPDAKEMAMHVRWAVVQKRRIIDRRTIADHNKTAPRFGSVA